MPTSLLGIVLPLILSYRVEVNEACGKTPVEINDLEKRNGAWLNTLDVA